MGCGSSGEGEAKGQAEEAKKQAEDAKKQAEEAKRAEAERLAARHCARMASSDLKRCRPF